MLRPTVAAFAFLMMAAACSGPAGDDATVRPFEEIATSEPVLEFDPSGTAATLRVTTSIDAVCAVAYGEGPELGMIATDQDMSGVGHQSHHPVLTGLQPDREYQYRLQGIGPDGTLYQSGLMTFRTPPADDTTRPNVAIGAEVVAVSSEFSDAFAAENALDGELSTEWSTSGDGDDAYIEFDLGAETHISGIGFLSRSMTDGSALTTSFTVTVDGVMFGPFDAGPGLAVANLDSMGRIVRVAVETSTGGNTGAVEIEVYAED